MSASDVTRRLFVAVDLPDEARRAVSGVADRLREQLRAADLERAFRWVAPENLHITLRFIGAVPSADAERIIASMSAPIDCDAGLVRLGAVAAFPPGGRPRLLHVSIDDADGLLTRLRARVDERLSPLCRWAPDTRPFTPHVTLARARDRHLSRLRHPSDLFHLSHHAIPVPVDIATLFQSRTLPTGPVYTREARARLRST